MLHFLEEVISRIQATAGEEARELLSLTYILASLVLETESQQTWLRKRFGMLHDILRDTWAYQEILKEGYEEGLEKGLEEGLEKGLEEGLEKGLEKGLEEGLEKERQRQSQMLMTLVQMHFPNSVELAKQRIDAITDPEVLQRVILHLLAAHTEQQAQQILLATQYQKPR